ncbi:MAG: UvrD-helicase domain-containing protein [Treponema sp.]|nr:UvrD-helicase domain-containing protein [Treponema sp.]
MLKRPQLNDEQKEAAFCVDNAVVSAGAGSGKTMVLANRFTWLLTEKGYKVDEILTLTFTKKAAAQMYSRIYSLVSDIARNGTKLSSRKENAEEYPPSDELIIKRAKNALDDFNLSRIQTLDSYCASIVRQCSPRYGISPDFRIDLKRCHDITLEVSYPFLIANRHHPAIIRLYSDNKPKDIVHNIFSDVLYKHCYIDKPRDFLSDLKNQFKILASEWKKYTENIKSILNEIKNDLNENNYLLPALVPLIEDYKKENILIPGSDDIQEYFNYLLSVSEDLIIEKSESHPVIKLIINFVEYMHSVSFISLKSGKKSENPVKINIYKLRSLMDCFISLSISCMQAGLMISIILLFSKLQIIYTERKRSEGVLTFSDVAHLARTILVEQHDIRQSEKKTFKAIMIDEFQDNNELQKNILFLLAEKENTTNKGIPSADDLNPKKLFFVGDEKQSIYLFRGADVSVFRRLKEEIKSRELPLKKNYRSASNLIGAFNALFGGGNFDSKGKSKLSVYPSVFAPPENLPVFEAGYTPLESNEDNEAGVKSLTNGNFSLCILNKKKFNDIENEEETLLPPEECEARFVAEKIKFLLTLNYQPQDIAILFRSRANQYLYEKHLRSLAVPYICEDINDLFYGGLVNDIMAVLRLAAHPMDKAAYSEMLRSPFAGLSLGGTAVCLSVYRDKTKTHEPFDDDPVPHLDETDKEKYLIGREIYYSIRKKSETENISSLVSELWYNEGYRYETEWNPATSVYRELYDCLFHLAANADAENQKLSSFTDSMIALRDSGGRLAEIEIPLEHQNAVHIMTIHKSKGLEFPVVFLCSCGNRGQSDRVDIVYVSDNTGIVFSPPPPPVFREYSGKRDNFFWELASEEIKQKRTAELRRLLYVGMTRAENELFITGSLDIRDGEEQEDFPLLIKKHIENKVNSKNNYIEGDSIINNDTFFGLLLPAVISHIPDSLSNQDKLKFINIEEIKFISQEYIKNEESKRAMIKNNQKNLNDFINKAKNIYKNARVIRTPLLYDNHITPVSVKNIKSVSETTNEKRDKPDTDDILGRGAFINRDYSGKESIDIFKKVDSILKRYSKNSDENNEKFNSGSFGTIAHICVEAFLNGGKVEIPSNISGLITPEEMSSLLEAGEMLAERFVSSPLGEIAKKANLRESEFSFRSIIKNKKGGEIFINGSVDLFFEDTEAVHIVDFKTDSAEIPREHTAQMKCYYNAISSLFAVPLKKQCRIWLYYLRTGHAVEMTEKVIKFRLEQNIFSNED